MAFHWNRVSKATRTFTRRSKGSSNRKRKRRGKVVGQRRIHCRIGIGKRASSKRFPGRIRIGNRFQHTAINPNRKTARRIIPKRRRAPFASHRHVRREHFNFQATCTENRFQLDGVEGLFEVAFHIRSSKVASQPLEVVFGNNRGTKSKSLPHQLVDHTHSARIGETIFNHRNMRSEFPRQLQSIASTRATSKGVTACP